MRLRSIPLSTILALLFLSGMLALAAMPLLQPLIRSAFWSGKASDAVEVEDTRAWESDAPGY